jgi:hypothetical protein
VHTRADDLTDADIARAIALAEQLLTDPPDTS